MSDSLPIGDPSCNCHICRKYRMKEQDLKAFERYLNTLPRNASPDWVDFWLAACEYKDAQFEFEAVSGAVLSAGIQLQRRCRRSSQTLPEIALLNEIGALLESVEYQGSYVDGIKAMVKQAKRNVLLEAADKFWYSEDKTNLVELGVKRWLRRMAEEIK